MRTREQQPKLWDLLKVAGLRFVGKCNGRGETGGPLLARATSKGGACLLSRQDSAISTSAAAVREKKKNDGALGASAFGPASCVPQRALNRSLSQLDPICEFEFGIVCASTATAE